MYNNDVTIIGNGILAFSIAYSLSKKDSSIRINIIGNEIPTNGATLASGAMLNCFAEITHKTFTNRFNEFKFEMALSASKMWDNWLEDINDQLNFSNKIHIDKGTHIILNSESGKLDTDNYLNIKAALDSYNQNYEILKNPCDIIGLNPVENYRPLQAMFLPDEGTLDSNKYLTSLKSILAQNENITFIDDIVIAIETLNNKIDKLKLRSNEEIHTDQVIVANGAYGQLLIDQIPELYNKIPKILSGVGYSIVLSQDEKNIVKNVIRTPNRAGACGLHVLPREDKLYVGATNNIYCSPKSKPNAGLMNFLIECAITQINQNLYDSEIEGWRVGNRPTTIDTFPLIGKTSIDRLWILNGTYRDGFHQSPLLANHMANLILDKEPLFDTSIFAPERKLIQTTTREESIDEFIYHYTAGAYEHGAKLPKFMKMNDLEEMLRCKALKVYDDLDTDIGLNPEMLVMLVLSSNPKEDIKFFRDYFKTVS